MQKQQSCSKLKKDLTTRQRRKQSHFIKVLILTYGTLSARRRFLW